MREFVVKKGKYEGIHKIYDNAKELEKDIGVSFVHKPWSHPDVKPGDWCYMDDGFIMQCLNRSELVSKKNGAKVEIYRFALASRPVYFRQRDEQRVAPLLYSTNPSANKSSIVAKGYDSSIGGSYDARKKLWVNLVSEGMDPLEATTSVYRRTSNRKDKMVTITNKLIEDTKIRKYLMKALVPFKNELEEKIADATNGSTLKEQIALEIAKLIQTEPKSIKDTTSKIKTLLDIAYLTGDIVKPSNSKVVQATEANYKEVQPPKLGETK